NISDVEEDQRTNNEFMADLNAEYHERALLANQKRFYKRALLANKKRFYKRSGRVGSARKPLDKTKVNITKAKPGLVFGEYYTQMGMLYMGRLIRVKSEQKREESPCLMAKASQILEQDNHRLKVHQVSA
ncbi:hypothetical protein Tco_1190023, partial [Tanacetum coccineum]